MGTTINRIACATNGRKMNSASHTLFKTNILRANTSYDSGASYNVKRTFYTHAIRALIDYSAPYLVTASPAQVKQLETLQNNALQANCFCS
ncbi:hypothetical protein E2C01_076272 [Portunus trituberculatus]|uniref:Uncharacterized protein n=1 Tax=Portunus trituberculatus TaxID=210409 RepID=A0A5B7IN70_PORTR|nr:hypothetical protein [Portunus trituberculatus]